MHQDGFASLREFFGEFQDRYTGCGEFRAAAFAATHFFFHQRNAREVGERFERLPGGFV